MSVSIKVGPNGKRIYLGADFPDIYFTRREVDVAQLLHHYKYREIGDKLNISRRTAEYYVMNMKKKLHCRSKRELCYLLKRSGVMSELATL